MTVSTPPLVAMRALLTLLPMPPDPRGPDRADLHALEFLEVVDRGDEPGVAVLRGIGRVEPVGVGEQDQQVGLDQQRHLRGKSVVVAEAELVGRGGVVLVDDRHHLPVQQAPQGVARVEVLGPGRHVESRQQHLGCDDVLVGEELGVDVEQTSLAHSRRRLQVHHLGRPPLAPEHSHARRDGPRRDQQHPVTPALQLAHLGHEPGYGGQAERAPLAGERAGADLDDYGLA